MACVEIIFLVDTLTCTEKAQDLLPGKVVIGFPLQYYDMARISERNIEQKISWFFPGLTKIIS